MSGPPMWAAHCIIAYLIILRSKDDGECLGALG